MGGKTPNYCSLGFLAVPKAHNPSYLLPTHNLPVKIDGLHSGCSNTKVAYYARPHHGRRVVQT
jgi:hypothetical protein